MEVGRWSNKLLHLYFSTPKPKDTFRGTVHLLDAYSKQQGFTDIGRISVSAGAGIFEKYGTSTVRADQLW